MKSGIQGRLLRFAMLLGFFSLAAGVGGWLVTRPLVEAADRFVSLVGQGRGRDAFNQLARNHAWGSLDAFERATRTMGLDQVASVSWGPRNFKGDDGTARGTAALRGGESRAVVVHLQREQGEWRVLAVEIEGTLAPAVASPLAVPSPGSSGALRRPSPSPR